MSEILVKNQICNACRADVRPGALFCYSCGKSLAPETFAADNHKETNVKIISFRENVSTDGEEQNKLKQEEVKREEKKEEIKIEKNIEVLTGTIAEKPLEKQEIFEQGKLKSAASLRRKSKVLPNKKIEIVWQEQESAPNVWFIIVALILTVFAVGIIFLAMYLR